MFRKILRWFFGYLVIELSGGFPERFINLCKNNNIYIWNLKNIQGLYQFEMLAKDYKHLKAIAKKTHTRPWIISKNGLTFQIRKYKKRRAFIFGFFLFFLLIYIFSLNIWNISVFGGRIYTEETILEFLETIDIYVGKRIKDIDCRKIEEDIRETYPDIGWVSAEIKGTNLIINLKEITMPSKEVISENPSHIIASKNGLITHMVTRTGTPLVKIGDVVKKGDILVSGVVDVIGDNEIIVSKEPVFSDADIIAKTYYEYRDVIPLAYIDKEYTGKSKKYYTINILSKKLNLYKTRISFKNYDIITEEIVFEPIPNFYFPLSMVSHKYDEYIEVAKVHTKDEAREIGDSNLNRVLNHLKENDVIIHDVDIDITYNKNSCIIEGKIIVEESIVAYKRVKESEWRTDVDESIGDSD